MATAQKREVKISEIIDLLSKGYVRYRDQDKGHGSIQEKYGLTVGEVSKIFQHEKLKRLKTKMPLSITLVDDLSQPLQSPPPLPVRQATASEQAEAVAVLASEGISRAHEEVERKLEDLFS